MPLMAMDMGPDTPEAANLERSRIAQNWPRIASLLGLHDEMGQMLPERNTGKTDEFTTARSLQIPQGIPLPNPDGSSPYPEMAPMGAGPMLPQQPQMPMRRPQLPYAAMGFGGPTRNMGKPPELPNAAALPDGLSPYPELQAPFGVPPMPRRHGSW